MVNKENIMNLFKKIWSFIKEAKVEFQKVQWPSKTATLNYTLVVIGLSLFIAIFLGLLDILFTYLLNKYIF